MKALSNILVVVEQGLRRTPAFERGAELAQRTGAQVHLRLFDNPLPTNALADTDQQALEREEFVHERLAWLSQQTAALAQRGIKADYEFVSTTHLHRAVLAKVLQLQPNLVVKDIHDWPHVDWLAFTPDEEQLLTFCPAPVMLVRANSCKRLRKILVAVDTAVSTERAELFNETIVRKALAIGRGAEAEVHLAQVFPHQALTGDTLLMARDHQAQARQIARDFFECFALRFDFRPGRYHWMEGKPADALADLVGQLGVDCLVIGNVYHSLLRKLYLELVGSKTEQLVTHTACDVIFVKEEHYEAELGRHVDLDVVCREYGVNWRHAA